MSDWQWIFSPISAIAWFLPGLSGFSRELMDVGGRSHACAERFCR